MPQPVSRTLIVVALVLTGLTLLFPPIGLAALVLGVVLLRRRHVAGTIVIAGLVVFGIAGYVVWTVVLIKPYRIPSEAMVPTLKVGSHVIVWRPGSVHVGDIVVFHPPAGAETNECGTDAEPGQPCPRPTAARSQITFIKRIVAGPGDTVAIIDGHTVRNGHKQKEPFINRCEDGGDCNFPNPITVPPGHYFMLGDNRGASDDSRYWGPVPEDWIVGRKILTY